MEKIVKKIDGITITVSFKGLNEWKENQNQKTNTYRVQIKNDNGKKFSFDFHDSIYNTNSKQILHFELIESIIESIQSDYYLTTDYYPTFNDFASDFGYKLHESDGYNVKSLYKKCMKHGAGLQKVISKDWLENIEVLNKIYN